MADDPLDGTSPWGDQPSLSNHNSSSSSLALASPTNDEQDPMAATVTLASNKDDKEDDTKMSASTPALPTSGAPATGSSSRRSSRGFNMRRKSGKLAKSVHLDPEQVADTESPLGPLGEEEDDKEEQIVAPKDDKQQQQERNANIDVERGLAALRVSNKENEAAVDSSQQSKPKHKFEITVGDPIKVGDITSAHTVYTVHTKTDHPTFGDKKDCSVTRRYRDFRWVFHALEHNNPGFIIPPPPEKQAMGRFNEDFVEARRSALETMLNKIGAHLVLQNDQDFAMFLQSDNFTNDSKHKVVNMDDIEHAHNQSNSKGFMGSLGGAFSFSAKYIETNDWFIEKKQYIDQLEAQLKSLSKALDLVVAQRRELGDATGEFSKVLDSLATVEVSKSLSNILANFSSAQQRIQDLYQRQCLQDILSLSTTLDEYVRLVASIKSVFLQRQKAFLNVQSAEQELAKKRQNLDKLNRQGKTLQDKITQVNQQVEDQEKRVVELRTVFDHITKTITGEFDRFELEKVHDFRNSVELFLENAIESQKEAIEIWETFYRLSGFSNHSASQDAESSTSAVS